MAPVGQGRGRGARGRRGWAFWKAACGTGAHEDPERGRQDRADERRVLPGDREPERSFGAVPGGPSSPDPSTSQRQPSEGGGSVRGSLRGGRARQTAERPHPSGPQAAAARGPPGALARGAPQLSLGPSLAVALGVPGDRGPASPPENHAGNATTRSGSRPGVLTRRRRSNMRRFAQFRLSRFRWNAGHSATPATFPLSAGGGGGQRCAPLTARALCRPAAASSSLDPQSRSLAHWRCDPRSPHGLLTELTS